jgi:hypothetical protein
MTWWRGIERTMLLDPRLEDRGSAGSAPFLEGPVALFLSQVATELLEQAREAAERGLPSIAPQLEGPDQFWEDAADYIEARGAWIDRAAASEPAAVTRGLVPLDEDLRDLRSRAVAAVRHSLQAKREGR